MSVEMRTLLAIALAGALGVSGGAASTHSGYRGPSLASAAATKDEYRAYLAAEGETGILIQNLDPTQDAVAVLELYGDSLESPFTIEVPTIAARESASVWLPDYAGSREGSVGVHVVADRLVRAIARMERPRTGSATFYGDLEPSGELVVPLAVKRFADQVSSVTIVNTDTSAPAVVKAELVATANPGPVASETVEISPGATATLDLSRADHFAAVPAGFLGSMRLTSLTPIAAMSRVRFESKAEPEYAFEAQPLDAAAETLYVPLFRCEYYGTTGISVVNARDTPVDVRVEYYGSLGHCPIQNFVQAGTIEASSSLVFYQGGDTPGTTSMPLYSYCAGSAALRTEGGAILAVVNDISHGYPPDTSAAYSASADWQGARTVVLPMLRSEHGLARMSSGIQLMNVGPEQAQVTLDLRLNTGPLPPSRVGVTIEPLRSQTIYLPARADVAPDTVANGYVTSDQPILAIVNDVSLANDIDSASHTGIPADW